MIALEIDLCTAGDLIDPDTKLHMRKALTIMTSSKSLFHDMCGLNVPENMNINRLRDHATSMEKP